MKGLKKLYRRAKKTAKEVNKLVDHMDAFVSEHQLDATTARPELIEAGKAVAAAKDSMFEALRQYSLHSKALKADKAMIKIAAKHGKKPAKDERSKVGVQ